MERVGYYLRSVFDSNNGAQDRIIARWVFLRALAAIYFSAFFSLLFQIKGLIGPQGILPAGEYLADVTHYFGPGRIWHAPTLFWTSTDAGMLMAVTWAGLIASVLALSNIWPRFNLFVCFICFLSFVAAAGDFSGYQSDGMLLEAGFLSLFFTPPGIWPGLGQNDPPSRANLFLLQWEWFRIYFESGLVKMLSGDVEWRNFTAMDEYYQNGPLPSWIGWYVQHLPHWFHAASVVITLTLEFAVVFMLFFPRRVRIICFLIVTPWQIGIILTSNYAFLNYLVLALGFLLLDDVAFRRLVPARLYRKLPNEQVDQSRKDLSDEPLHVIQVGFAAVVLTWIGYATTAQLVQMIIPGAPLPSAPVKALEPFRIANQYGLFAVMTRGRYEIEFQGSNDGQNWQPYTFRYKPQLLSEPPGIYAPYQPRFDWNLWFASLVEWRQTDIVPLTEVRLLENDRDVLDLFRRSPFGASPPRFVRAVLWQYWFTSMDERRSSGNWWRRDLLGLYAPIITREADGRFAIVELPSPLPSHD
jgi:lipase maturation factor 1